MDNLVRKAGLGIALVLGVTMSCGVLTVATPDTAFAYDYKKAVVSYAKKVYKAIANKRCTHTSMQQPNGQGQPAYNYSQMISRHKVNCNVAASVVLQKAGILKKNTIFGHTLAGYDNKNATKPANTPSALNKYLFNWQSLNLYRCSVIPVDKTFAKLPAEYKEAGCVYIYDSNIAINIGMSKGKHVVIGVYGQRRARDKSKSNIVYNNYKGMMALSNSNTTCFNQPIRYVLSPKNQTRIAVADIPGGSESGRQVVKWIKNSGWNPYDTRYKVEPILMDASKVKVANFDGLIIPGGVNDVTPSLYHQKNTHSENTNENYDLKQIAVAQAFVKAGKPVLGICRGSQILNVALEGTLKQHIGSHRGIFSTNVKSGSWIAKITGAGNSTKFWHYHHQAVDKLGSDLVATAWCGNNNSIIEGYENKNGKPIWGVQFHPESDNSNSTVQSNGKKIALAFREACQKQHG